MKKRLLYSLSGVGLVLSLVETQLQRNFFGQVRQNQRPFSL